MNWPIVPLNSLIAETRNGLYKHGSFYGRGTQILKMFNIQSGRLNLSRVDRVEVTDEELAMYQLQPGDILVNRVNTPDLVGKCAVIPPDLGEAVFESKNIRVRLKRELVEPSFVAYYLNSPAGRQAIKRAVKHAIGMATINNSDLGNCLVPLAPLSEQARIFEILFEADALRTRRAEADAKSDRILPAIFYRMFGDLATNPRGFAIRKAHEVALLMRGDFRHRPRTEPRFYGGPYPFIQINDITSSKLVIRRYSQTLNEEGLAISRMFRAGTVVLSIAATIAASGILGFDSCFPDSLVGVEGKPGRATQEFLLFFFRAAARRLAAEAPRLAQSNINLQILNNMDLPMPPFEHQQTFSTRVQCHIGTLEHQERSGRAIEDLWASLVHRAFAGELTAKWRRAHMKELLQEIEIQARAICAPDHDAVQPTAEIIHAKPKRTARRRSC